MSFKYRVRKRFLDSRNMKPETRLGKRIMPSALCQRGRTCCDRPYGLRPHEGRMGIIPECFSQLSYSDNHYYRVLHTDTVNYKMIIFTSPEMT
ncbi:protein of unknown function [Candidatus Methylomirabilis oxygeniifera]|uniref:Uncharacterized protein n=1 Tax=Methylomirabilis oxygeniifera TaxID=671143 RepID=D5MNA3_METO1|nr:protein of unknown function [Candidatus Methylomirabilis oxyfera]